MSFGQTMDHQRAVGQHGLFLGGSGSSALPADDVQHDLPEVDDWTEDQQLAGEYSVLGFYVSGHPLDKFAGRLQEFGATELGALEGKRNDDDIIVAGIIVQSRPMRSKKGERWGIYTLQDRTGVVDLLVFAKAFAKLEGTLRAGTALLVKGRVVAEEAGTRIVVSDARALEDMAQAPPTLLRVRVDLGAMDSEVLDRLQDLFLSRPGRCRVAFELVNPDGTMATLETQNSVQPDAQLVEAVREICGLDAVAVVR